MLPTEPPGGEERPLFGSQIAVDGGFSRTGSRLQLAESSLVQRTINRPLPRSTWFPVSRRPIVQSGGPLPTPSRTFALQAICLLRTA